MSHEYVHTLDTSWDAIRDLDNRPDGMSANDLTVLADHVRRASTELQAVCGRLRVAVADATDAELT